MDKGKRSPGTAETRCSRAKSKKIPNISQQIFLFSVYCVFEN